MVSTFEKLAERDPANADRQIALSSALETLGDTQLAAGDTDAALRAIAR